MNVLLALALGLAIGVCLGHMSGYLHAAREDQAHAAAVRRVNREADDALRLTIAEMGDMLAERGQTIQRMRAEQAAAAATVVQLSAALHQAVGERGGAVVMDENVLSRFNWN